MFLFHVAFHCVLAFQFEYLPETGNPPSKRLYSTLCSTDDSLVSFGGELDNSVSYNDLWTFSLAESRWTPQSSATQLYPSID